MSANARGGTASAGGTGEGGARAPLAFTKMHGLGNDFMVVDNTGGALRLDAARVRRLADRRTGVGFDQLLVVERPSHEEAAFDYRIYNADGGEVEHCGNGARCFARFVVDRGLADAGEIVVYTRGGLVTLRTLDDGRVTVKMGVPEFRPGAIPFLPDASPNGSGSGSGSGEGEGEGGATRDVASPDGRYALDVDGERLTVGAVAIGNPHVVVPVEDVERAPLERLGPRLESDPRFPARVNVGFVERVSATRLRLRVYERGVGETRACGTGACAAVAVGQRQGLLERRVRVSLPGGELEVFRADEAAQIEMTGPCSTVFEGHTGM